MAGNQNKRLATAWCAAGRALPILGTRARRLAARTALTLGITYRVCGWWSLPGSPDSNSRDLRGLPDLEGLNDPNRADDPEYIVRLIGRVVTVSVETVKLVTTLTGKHKGVHVPHFMMAEMNWLSTKDGQITERGIQKAEILLRELYQSFKPGQPSQE